MAVPTKREARAILEPFHELIANIIHDAFGEWRATQALRRQANFPPHLYDRTKANEVFDAIARRAIALFGAEDRVAVLREAQTVKVIFRGQILARFKKAGDDWMGSNIRTQAAMAFMEADGVLPGLPPETAKVEFVWFPNDIWTEVEQIMVVARDGDVRLWEYEIGQAKGAGALVPLPRPPAGPADMEDDDLVVPKAKPETKPAKK